MTDLIHQQTELQAPPARVWQALTDHHQFGEWFHVTLDGPFRPGQPARGAVTYPGYEHLTWEATIQELDHERLFSFTWHPHATDPTYDYAAESCTLVEFRLDAAPRGTRLALTESGFDRIPVHRRAETFRSQEEGWSAQLQNIARYVQQ